MIWQIVFQCKALVTHSLQPVGDLLATKISGGRRESAGRLRGGRRLVGDRLQKVAGTILSQRVFWLLQVKPLCDQIDRRKGFLWSPTGCQLVVGWLATDRRPVTAVADNPDTVSSRRRITDQSPIGCRPIYKKLQTFCNHKQTLKIQSPTSRRLIANRLPIAPQLIADGSATTVRLHDSIV